MLSLSMLQLYVEHSQVDVATHNAESIQLYPEEPPLPEDLALFSLVFGCIHGSEQPITNKSERQPRQPWANTRCTAQVCTLTLLVLEPDLA